MNGEAARDVVDVATARGDGGAHESERRVVVDVEEIGAAQVLIAIAFGSVDAPRLDRDVDARVLRVRIVERDRAAEA